jgi:hypothetical protein
MSDWLWLALLLLTNGALIWTAQSKYRFGIADGAFNQSLPHVQDAMLAYDRERALKALKDKDIPLHRGATYPFGQHDVR